MPVRDDAGVAAHLPGDATHDAHGWQFEVPEGGVEQALTRLIGAGHGIAGLSIERPGLHDAFVRIVGAAGRDDSKNIGKAAPEHVR